MARRAAAPGTRWRHEIFFFKLAGKRVRSTDPEALLEVLRGYYARTRLGSHVGTRVGTHKREAQPA